MRALVWFVMAWCGLALSIGPALAQEGQPADAAGMSKEAAMEAMQQYGTPGEAHKALEPLVGTWTYTGEWRMSPEAPAAPMTGQARHTMIFGGRFLKQDVTGVMEEGQPPFEGIGFTGYDNLRKEYASVWLGSMGTGIMVASGQFDPTSNTLTQQCDFSCPVTGEAHRRSRETWTIVDENHNTYESYMRTPEGTEFKAMELHYTRTEPSS